MAYATGTATNAADLYSKLLTFLTANASLVAAGQQWTVPWSGSGDYANDRVLEGPGLSGDDQVFVAMRLESDVPNDRFAIIFQGVTGYLTLASEYSGHVNPSNAARMYLSNTSMTYWFVANGRRFVVVVKVSTVYEAMYAGLYLPYALPTTYPYPLFIGGSGPGNYTLTNTWRSTLDSHAHFTQPYASNSLPAVASASLIDPSGLWMPVINAVDNSAAYTSNYALMGPSRAGTGFNTSLTANTGILGYPNVVSRIKAGFGSVMPLIPFAIVQQQGGDVTWGTLDGVFKVPGVGNAAENLITHGGVDHLVVQNCFRTGTDNYWALALE